MKNVLKLTIFALSMLFIASCKQEELRVHYPASMPVFNSASVTENAITYGDSISLNAQVSDPKTPLSTLEIKVVVNDVLIASESVRTKGYDGTYSKKYKIPFAPYMPNGAEVEVHLSTINVEGTKRDTVIHNTIASRPPIPTLWLVTPTKTVELPLIDAVNHIYSASGLAFGNDINFKIATKVNKFKKIDWADPTNIVFGYVNSAIGFVDANGSPITLTNLTLVGYNKITLDLFNFTIKGEGDKLVPATTMNVGSFTDVLLSSTDHLNVTTKETWKSAQIYLGENTEMTISGVSDLANGLTPDFFQVTGANTAKFLGKTGVYTVYYLPRMDYVFVEQPTAVYPDALWLCGVGFGPARTPYTKTSSWNWNSPLEYKFCRKVSDGVFDAVMYVNHEEDGTALEPWRVKFSAKFFHQRGWGGEEDARTYTLPASLVALSDGNWGGADALMSAPGVYRITINLNTKTTNFVKIK